MIRPTLLVDTPTLLALAQGTGVFQARDIQALEEVLADFHDSNREAGHRCVTWEETGQVFGFAYYAPAALTDRTWYLWWIAVRKQRQAGGIGGELMQYVEEDIRRARGRVIFIETSSLPHYELTRRFYRKLGYAQPALLEDYYAEGDDMVIFRKALDIIPS